MSRFFDELEERLREAAAEQRDARRAAFGAPRRRRRRLAVVAVAAAAALAVPAVGAVGDLWRPDVERRAPMTTAAPSGRGVSCDVPSSRRIDVGPPVGAAFTSVLGVLARPRTSADAFDRRYLRPLHLRDVDLDGIRFVGTAGGSRWFVIPSWGLGRPQWPERCLRKLDPRAREHFERPVRVEPTICLFGGGGSGCAPLARIREGGTFGTSGVVRGRATATGLAPNGVRAVRVTYGRSSRDFPVVDNFFSFRVAVDVEQAPDRVEWLMDDGSVRDVTP